MFWNGAAGLEREYAQAITARLKSWRALVAVFLAHAAFVTTFEEPMVEERLTPCAGSEECTEEDAGIDGRTAFAGPIDVAQVEPEGELVEGKGGADAVHQREQTAEEDVLGSVAAADLAEPGVADGEKDKDAPDEVVDVSAAHHDPAEGSPMMGDGHDEKPNAAEGNEEGPGSEQHAAARAVLDVTVDDVSELGEVEEEQHRANDERSKDEQDPGSGEVHGESVPRELRSSNAAHKWCKDRDRIMGTLAAGPDGRFPAVYDWLCQC